MQEIWSMEQEAQRLHERFDALKEQLGVGQAAFARKFEVPGGPSMVSQHIKARRPINLEAALKYAEGFQCGLEDISPRLFAELEAANRAKAKPVMAIEPIEERRAFVRVPMLANAGAMGSGTHQLADDVVVGAISLSPGWVKDAIKPTNPTNLRFMNAYGDSMTPTLSDGDIVLVDTGSTDASVDGVYVLEAHRRIFIKRVRQRMDGQFEISSDNQSIKTTDLLSGDHAVRVLGRVLWVWNGVRL